VTCPDCGWEELVEKIEAMDDSGKFGWAQDSIEGIKETVERNEHATDGQRTAIDNIANSKPGWDD